MLVILATATIFILTQTSDEVETVVEKRAVRYISLFSRLNQGYGV